MDDAWHRLLLMAAIAAGTLVLVFWIIVKSKCRFCHDRGYCFYDPIVWGEEDFRRLNDWSDVILVEIPAYCCKHCSKGTTLHQRVLTKEPTP
jgi:hypothetical protein